MKHLALHLFILTALPAAAQTVYQGRITTDGGQPLEQV